MKKEIDWENIDHCQDENGQGCGLGSNDFTCPICGLQNIRITDYWFEWEKCYEEGKTVEITCEHCKGVFKLSFNEEGDWEAEYEEQR